MSKTDLLHIRVGKEMKKQMQKLIEIGMFSTEAEIAREGIRTLILKYMKDAGYEDYDIKDKNIRKNGKKKN